MTEEWRPIPSLPDYLASDRGRIMSRRRGFGLVMDGSLSGSGYWYVKVTQGGKKKSRSVHSLVCEAFHGPRPDGMEVRHMDGVHTNNVPSNLRWGSPSENRYDSVRHGTHGSLSRRRSTHREPMILSDREAPDVAS